MGERAILVRCDGKIITKVGTLCKDGEPNMAPVIRRTRTPPITIAEF